MTTVLTWKLTIGLVLFLVFVQHVPCVTALTLNNNKAHEDLAEDNRVPVSVLLIDVTDPTLAITCIVTSGNPFEARQDGALDWYIWYNGNLPSLVYDIQIIYIVDVTCTTTAPATVTGTYFIYLTPNAPPTFDDLPETIQLSATTTVGTTFYTIATTDPEGDTRTFGFSSCEPSGCPFTIGTLGGITLNTDISATTETGYDVVVYANDGINVVGPSILTVEITDINNGPVITNLPGTPLLTIVENVGLGVSIYSASYVDYDTGETHTYSMTVTPSEGATYFEIDTSTGVISSSATNNINFETLSSYSFALSVTVSDGSKTDTSDLNIDIYDVNEAPVISQALYSVTTFEGALGTSIGNPTIGITDEDSGDSTTQSINCGTETKYYSIDESSGAITFAINYDTDAGSLPTSATCALTATDTKGLTDTTTLIININDANDNTPTFYAPKYTYFTPINSSVATYLGSVQAFDNDVDATFGAIIYTFDQTSTGGNYFGYETTDGNVTTANDLTSLTPDTTYSTTLTAIDGGGLSSSTDICVVVTRDLTITTTTTTTERYVEFIEKPANVALIVLSVFTGLILACFLIWFCLISRSMTLKPLCMGGKPGKDVEANTQRQTHFQNDNKSDIDDFRETEPPDRKGHPPKEMPEWRKEKMFHDESDRLRAEVTEKQVSF